MSKKCLSIILTAILLVNLCTTAFSFTFPEPDWGMLYKEKTAMVTATDFELYAEADITSAPYYGAKFEPRGGTYIGSVADTSEKLRPLGAYLTNIDGMGQYDLYYPSNTMIKKDNVISMVGWTVYDLTTVDYAKIRKTLDTLNKYNKPMFIRFANEMNCSNLGDDPNLYVEIFRNVANIIHEYPNFAVVWSPNDLGALDRPFEYFYPGDEYVDWIGVSSYMVKYFQGNRNTEYKNSVFFMSGDYSWATNKIKPLMDFMQKNSINKPVMISECGVATNNKYGEEYQSWTEPRLRNLLWYLAMKYPQIKMINYFDYHNSYETERFDIYNYSYAIDIFNEAKNSGAYITQYGQSPKFVFQPANYAGTLVAKNGRIPLYTLAHIPEVSELTVNYYIDGNWYGASTQIPYKCDINISDLSDGKHILKILTLNNEKEYVLYKKGQCISFGSQPSADFAESYNSNPIKVVVNGVQLTFDQPPIVQNGRTLVPLRAIFQSLGAVVDWNNETQTVTAVRDNIVISLTLGSNILYVNNNPITLDVPAQAVNGRTLVPVRAVAESFDCFVDWDGNTQTVIIEI